MKTTLAEWQKILKPRSSIIYNASEFDRQCDGWVPFTIGVSYKYIWESNLPEIQIGTHTNLVFVAFREETDRGRRPNAPVTRCTIANTLRSHGFENEYIHEHQYFSKLPNYKFVASPEGNGIDCHRHYEALLAGCIPIVEDHVGIREKYAGCPVLYTHDYSEITSEYLTQKYEEMLHQEWDFSKLFLESYLPEIQEQIKANGNYWGVRLTQKKWYT
jgi:hypothetical protein